ncbi:DUF4124 domain-containing protein [Lysobacter fragariae]
MTSRIPATPARTARAAHSSRIGPTLLLGLCTLAFACPAFAGKVYQWKDANGVSHYSDSAPPEQGYKNRQMKDGPAAPVADAKPAENAACTKARGNKANLDSGVAVGIDANNDGKADRELTKDERAQQVAWADAMIKTSCTPAAAKP